MKGINAMKTTELFQNKSVLSFEVFPPKRTNPVDTIYKTIDSLKDLDPDLSASPTARAQRELQGNPKDCLPDQE